MSKTYIHAYVSTGFTIIAPKGEAWIELRPNWFARVILRRPSLLVYPDDVAATLAKAARMAEERHMMDMWLP